MGCLRAERRLKTWNEGLDWEHWRECHGMSEKQVTAVYVLTRLAACSEDVCAAESENILYCWICHEHRPHRNPACNLLQSAKMPKFSKPPQVTGCQIGKDGSKEKRQLSTMTFGFPPHATYVLACGKSCHFTLHVLQVVLLLLQPNCRGPGVG